jgi:hypothetical protein
MNATDDMREIEELSVSNWDHVVPYELEVLLVGSPNEVFAHHYGHDFCGRIYFDGRNFVEEVFRNGAFVGAVNGTSLDEVVESVNDEYGSD